MCVCVICLVLFYFNYKNPTHLLEQTTNKQNKVSLQLGAIGCCWSKLPDTTSQVLLSFLC